MLLPKDCSQRPNATGEARQVEPVERTSPAKGLLAPASLKNLPATAAWPSHAEATRRIMREKYGHLANFLEQVPRACIGGILCYVALNLVKPAEVKQVFGHNRFHIALMLYTAVMVIVTDFLTGVLTAIILYAVLFKFFDRPSAGGGAHQEEPMAQPGEAAGQLAQANGPAPANALDSIQPASAAR